MDMMVLLLSDIDPQGDHISIPNINSLKYNLEFTNSTSFDVAISSAYCSNNNLDPFPAPALFISLTGTHALTHQGNDHEAIVQNNQSKTIILLLSV